MSHVRAITAENGIEFRQGDILFIRVGFTAHYNKLSADEQQAFPDRQPGGLLGLEATKDSLWWLWESRFAAIASDAGGFERGPATGPYNDPDVSIHQWALAGWGGMPIGELFDLEELAQKCADRQRWTFFLCSIPLKVSHRGLQHEYVGVGKDAFELTSTDSGRCRQSWKRRGNPLVRPIV